MNVQPIKILTTAAATLWLMSNTYAQTSPSPVPNTRYNSKVNPADYLITQEKRGEWAVNCRQRIYPDAGEKRCSATDGTRILKFKEASSKPAHTPSAINNIQLKKGYVLQLAAFSSQESALRFQKMHPEIQSQIVSTTIQEVQMFNVITPVIDSFSDAKLHAEKTSKSLGYLPWIRNSESI